VFGSTDGTDTHESSYSNGNKVTSFTISSPTDFDSTHLANTSLNNYFLYGNGVGGSAIEKCISDERLPQNIRGSSPTEPWSANDYLILMHPPLFTGDRVFIIKIDFKDNTTISDTTSHIYLY
jgi:hypothetical protein